MTRTLVLGVAVVLTVAVPACGGDGDESSSASGTYVFLPKTLANPYWIDARKGLDAEAEKLGVKTRFVGPALEPDPSQQIAIFERAIAQRPDGIAVSPADPDAIRSTIQRAVDAGIPVVAWDSEAPGSAASAYVGTDNAKAGAELAELVVEVTGGEGQVAVLVGNLTAQNSRLRIAGMRRALRDHPGIRIVATKVTFASIETSAEVATRLLERYPRLKAFAGITAADAPGAALAVRRAGRCGEVAVVGFDVIAEAQQLMRAGCIQALISQRPYGMTARALRLLTRLADGEEPPAEKIDTGVIVVRPDELDEFLEEPH